MGLSDFFKKMAIGAVLLAGVAQADSALEFEEPARSA